MSLDRDGELLRDWDLEGGLNSGMGDEIPVRVGEEGALDELDGGKMADGEGDESGELEGDRAPWCEEGPKMDSESGKRGFLDFKLNADTGGRAGGVYIPPAKRALLEGLNVANGENSDQEDIRQRSNWERLRRGLNALVNKASIYNIKEIVPEMFKFNLVRGRGLLCKSLMKSQIASPIFTPVYAAIVAVINTKIPDIGELLIMRLISQFRKAYKRHDKATQLAASKFIAHLTNQLVCGLVVPFQILILLLNTPTYDSIEIATSFVTEVGALLSEVSPKSLSDVFDRFRAVLNEGQVDKRIEYLIESAFAARKRNFEDNPPIQPELDLVEEGDQITHDRFSIDEDDSDAPPILVHDELNYYKFDPDFDQHEEKYNIIKKEILDEEDEEDEEENEEEDQGIQPTQIHDMTGEEINKWKRSIYLIQMSSLDHDEATHKLMKAGIPPGEEFILCNMIIQCCAEERTYLKFYALIAQRLCLLEFRFQIKFEQLFEETYMTSHRLESNSIRNVSQFFAHLFFTDAITWKAFQVIRLNIRDTNASRRIFVQILFNTMAEYLGLSKLTQRLEDQELQPYLTGLFPTDNPGDTKWAINYWTAIRLDGLTIGLRTIYQQMIERIAAASSSVKTPNFTSRDRHYRSRSSSSCSSDSCSSSYSSSSISSSGYSSCCSGRLSHPPVR